MSRRLIYVAHPVSGDPLGNCARAKRWLAWLMRRQPGLAFIAPWISAIEAGADDSDPVQRERGMADNIAVVQRCDGIVLVGGRISSGMSTELTHAKAQGAVVYDLTLLGDEPPDGPSELDARPW